MASKEFLSTAEATAMFGLPPSTLKRLRGKGTGPVFIKFSGQRKRPGGRVMYHIDDIREWLAQNKHGGKA